MSHLNCDTNRNAGVRAALASVVMAGRCWLAQRARRLNKRSRMLRQ